MNTFIDSNLNREQTDSLIDLYKIKGPKDKLYWSSKDNFGFSHAGHLFKMYMGKLTVTKIDNE